MFKMLAFLLHKNNIAIFFNFSYTEFNEADLSRFVSRIRCAVDSKPDQTYSLF